MSKKLFSLIGILILLVMGLGSNFVKARETYKIIFNGVSIDVKFGKEATNVELSCQNYGLYDGNNIDQTNQDAIWFICLPNSKVNFEHIYHLRVERVPVVTPKTAKSVKPNYAIVFNAPIHTAGYLIMTESSDVTKKFAYKFTDTPVDIMFPIFGIAGAEFSDKLSKDVKPVFSFVVYTGGLQKIEKDSRVVCLTACAILSHYFAEAKGYKSSWITNVDYHLLADVSNPGIDYISNGLYVGDLCTIVDMVQSLIKKENSHLEYKRIWFDNVATFGSASAWGSDNVFSEFKQELIKRTPAVMWIVNRMTKLTPQEILARLPECSSDPF